MFHVKQSGRQRASQPGQGASRPSRSASACFAALEDDIRVGDHTFKLGASIGVALYPKDGATADELMHHADLAMYQAKSNEQPGLRFFEPTPERRSA